MMQCLRRNAGSRTERFGGEPVGEAVGHVAGLGRECGERFAGAVAGAVEPDGAETVGGAAEAVGEGLGGGITAVRAGERGEGDLAGVGEAFGGEGVVPGDGAVAGGGGGEAAAVPDVGLEGAVGVQGEGGTGAVVGVAAPGEEGPVGGVAGDVAAGGQGAAVTVVRATAFQALCHCRFPPTPFVSMSLYVPCYLPLPLLLLLCPQFGKSALSPPTVFSGE